MKKQTLRADDIRIGYEIWARPDLDIYGLYEELRASSTHTNAAAWKAFSAIWERVSSASLLGEAKAFCIYQLASQVSGVRGDMIEFGVYRGGLSFMLGLMQEQAASSKTIVMCDNFDAGLPRPNREIDLAYAQGAMAWPVAEVKSLRRRLNLSKRCVLAPGLFSKTLRALPPTQRFSFAHVDCDLHAGTRQALQYVFPRLSAGAPLVIDDYYDESGGVMRAVNEFASEREILIHVGVFGQAYLIKDESISGVEPCVIGQHRVFLPADAARNGPLFLKYLRAVATRKAARLKQLDRFIEWCDCC
jgi:hypothetical protein